MIPKFRAWDKQTHRLINVLVIDWLNEMVDLEGGRIDRQFDKVEFMQSTGLKDKNGVEIFEGDIVLISVDNGFDYLDNKKTVVQKSEFHSGLICKSLTNRMEYRVFKRNEAAYEYEVVGNIYENSELLEVE
ncbi:hypothetical protein IGJ48_002677 [Enterococcus pernyi]